MEASPWNPRSPSRTASPRAIRLMPGPRELAAIAAFWVGLRAAHHRQPLLRHGWRSARASSPRASRSPRSRRCSGPSSRRSSSPSPAASISTRAASTRSRGIGLLVLVLRPWPRRRCSPSSAASCARTSRPSRPSSRGRRAGDAVADRRRRRARFWFGFLNTLIMALGVAAAGVAAFVLAPPARASRAGDPAHQPARRSAHRRAAPPARPALPLQHAQRHRLARRARSARRAPHDRPARRSPAPQLRGGRRTRGAAPSRARAARPLRGHRARPLPGPAHGRHRGGRRRARRARADVHPPAARRELGEARRREADGRGTHRRRGLARRRRARAPRARRRRRRRGGHAQRAERAAASACATRARGCSSSTAVRSASPSRATAIAGSWPRSGCRIT